MTSMTHFLYPKLNCFLSLLFSLYISHLCSAQTKGMSKPNVTAIFAFGDSIVDPGNNNDLFTIAKANFPPYGKDFKHGKPTGRFSNGRIPSDFLAEALGIKQYMPAYLDPNLQENDLLSGVSFASGASGFDPLTPRLFLVRTLDDELKMFEEYIAKVKGMVGDSRAKSIINNGIYFVVAGTDDLATTYFTIPFVRNVYDVGFYTDTMRNSASSFIKKLYKFGARRIFITNIPPIGCLPTQRTLGGGLRRDCAKDRNSAAQLFNNKLAVELKILGDKLRNSEIVYVDIYDIFLHLILNGTNYGFEVVDRGCCGSGLIEMGPLCNWFSFLCENDSKFLFWDGYHPSERAYRIVISHVIDRYLKHII